MNNNIDKNLLGIRLKKLMKDYNETTYSLGKVLNLSPPTISRYTRGEMIPKMTTIQAIAKHFNVNPNWLSGTSNSIFENEILNEDSSLTSVPIFKSIKYNLPLFSNEKIDQELNIPIELLSKWGAVIGYQIQDNAMAPFISKGNFIIIKLGNVQLPQNYVALHINENNLIIRKVLENKNNIILQPASLDYNAEVYNIHQNNIHIIGKVVYIHKEQNEILEK